MFSSRQSTWQFIHIRVKNVYEEQKNKQVNVSSVL